MSRRPFPDRARAEEHLDDPVEPPGQGEPLAADHLRRLATLVASGEAPIPTDLDPTARRYVLLEVARQRRARLVSYIARTIAVDIQRSREP